MYTLMYVEFTDKHIFNSIGTNFTPLNNLKCTLHSYEVYEYHRFINFRLDFSFVHVQIDFLWNCEFEIHLDYRIFHNVATYNKYLCIYYKKSLKIPTGSSEAVERRTDNTVVSTMDKRKRTNNNLQNITHEPHWKSGVNSGVLEG
jgi:hypothetical protein